MVPNIILYLYVTNPLNLFYYFTLLTYNASSLSLDYDNTDINKSDGEILNISFVFVSYLAYLGVDISNSNNGNTNNLEKPISGVVCDINLCGYLTTYTFFK